ncbi:MAG: tRNA pseudouridine(13) synthase TruD [Nitrosopumilus sp.]|nr:tRNA pseudouridine(13) synthase TruD [Nitrosopumilus sp.]MDA7958843.1 tRNA pseudouridine(13) synthase TruD [Nitrosopumilus sp.]
MNAADRAAGMLVYGTGTPGCGGRIRSSPDDFKVREVLSEAALREIGRGGRYAVYLLRKRGIDTMHAIREARSATGLRLKALGLKDADAATVQFVSSTRAGSHAPASGARWSLEAAGSAPRPLSAGDMEANEFEITIRGAGPAPPPDVSRLPNFYGRQRFGSSRPVTHLVGRHIVRGDLGAAVAELTTWEGAPDGDEERLGAMPRWMDAERAVLSEMIRTGDPLRAMRAAPVQSRRLYVQAYQSYIFNLALSAAVVAGEDLGPADGDVCYGAGGRLSKYSGDPSQAATIPLAGHSYYARTRFDRYVAQAMGGEDVRHAGFAAGELGEAACEGGFRQAAMTCTGFSMEGGVARFRLSRGSYATVLLREVVKPEDPGAAGF